jgi:hypothetical protein
VRHEVYKDFVNEAMRDLANWGSSYCLTERELIAVGKMLWAATQMLQDIQQLRDDQLPLRAQLWEAERLSAAFVDRAIAHLDEDRR